jgi:hypothetical protein
MSMYPISSNTLKDLKAHIDSNTVMVVGNIYTPLSPIDKSSKQKVNKK